MREHARIENRCVESRASWNDQMQLHAVVCAQAADQIGKMDGDNRPSSGTVPCETNGEVASKAK